MYTHRLSGGTLHNIAGQKHIEKPLVNDLKQHDIPGDVRCNIVGLRAIQDLQLDISEAYLKK